MKKRLLAMLLSAVMIISLLPTAAFAADGQTQIGRDEEVSSNEDYAYIEKLLAHDNSISFDPERQTFLVIDVDAVQSENLKQMNIYKAEEHIKEYELIFDVSINDAPVAAGQTYYLVSADTIETASVSDSFKMTANSGKVAVFILNKNDAYSASYTVDSNGYYTNERWTDENGINYSGDMFACRPTSHELVTKYEGTANKPVNVSFSFEWDLCNFLDIEIWMADTIHKQMENPGWGFSEGATGYVDFKIELRDSSGNITLLPRTYFNNYNGGAGEDVYSSMDEDGVVSIPLKYSDSTVDIAPYGEFDIYIPFGYDYRITLLSYSVDTLGEYAYYYNEDHILDDDEFCITNKSITYTSYATWEWGAFLEFTFMPLTKEIRIEKTVEGNEPENAEYVFQATELIPSFIYDSDTTLKYKKINDLHQILCNYPYELYDAKTGAKIDESSLKTDENGCFSMKSGQYAIFKTWELPTDFDDYTGEGFHIKGIYDSFSKGIPLESEYIVEEIKSPDCTTAITHTHEGITKTVDGKKVENVYGGDNILYKNIFSTTPDKTGSLTISKAVTGTGTPNADTLFEFTVAKAGVAASGQYSVDGSDTQAIPADGKISIKSGESALLTGLEPGEYTVTETSPTQANYKSTTFSVDGGEVQDGCTATVTVSSATTIVFTNAYVRKSGGGGSGSSSGGNSKPVVVPDDVPTGLNGDDHYAYIVGYPDGNVKPSGNITRAEVATIFFRLLTEDVRTANSTQSNSLSDVSRGQWFNHAISTLSSMGIVKGHTDGTFAPDDPITRAEFAAIAARFDDKNTDTSSDFSDIASHWAKDEIGIAANKGWINGYPDSTFRPDQYITRAEAMTIVNRVLNRLPEKSDDLLDEMIKWPDNADESLWYYLAVQEATNSHYYEAQNTQYEKWTKLRETRDWTELEK